MQVLGNESTPSARISGCLVLRLGVLFFLCSSLFPERVNTLGQNFWVSCSSSLVLLLVLLLRISGCLVLLSCSSCSSHGEVTGSGMGQAGSNIDIEVFDDCIATTRIPVDDN